MTLYNKSPISAKYTSNNQTAEELLDFRYHQYAVQLVADHVSWYYAGYPGAMGYIVPLKKR